MQSFFSFFSTLLSHNQEQQKLLKEKIANIAVLTKGIDRKEFQKEFLAVSIKAAAVI